MSTTEKLHLAWGCNRALPDGVRYAWGARMIAPADLLYNRTDFAGGEQGDEGRTALADWLSGGAGEAARQTARDLNLGIGTSGQSSDVYTLYRDEQGTIMGSPQRSYGYVYIAAWLHEHVA